LARLDVVQTQANLDVLTAQMLVAEAQIHRLKAERVGADSIQWPPVLNQANEPRIADVLAEQEALFDKRQNALAGEISILSQRADQLRSRIEGLRESKDTKQLLLQSVTEEYDNLSQLLDEGFVDETRVRDFERRIVELRGDLQSIDSEIQSAEIQIGEAELQMLQTRSVFDRDLQSQLTELQGRRDELREQMRVAEDRLNRANIVAPVDGVVLTIEVTTERGVVPASQPFITIVPGEDELRIEAQWRLSMWTVFEWVRWLSCSSRVRCQQHAENLRNSLDGVRRCANGSQFSTTYYLASLEIPPEEAF
jgi:Chromosome segregation ATPases